MQTVGQLDQQHPHVPADGQDEFAQVLGLARMLGLQLQPRQLGHALDQHGDLFAEHLRNVVSRRRRILDHVMQQGRDDGGGVELVVGQYARDLDRVGEIGIARGPQLRAVHLHRIDVGAVQQRFVGGGVIGLDRLDQFELAHDRCALGIRQCRAFRRLRRRLGKRRRRCLVLQIRGGVHRRVRLRSRRPSCYLGDRVGRQ